MVPVGIGRILEACTLEFGSQNPHEAGHSGVYLQTQCWTEKLDMAACTYKHRAGGQRHTDLQSLLDSLGKLSSFGSVRDHVPKLINQESD